ncbi:MAG: hypothetical protein M3355_01060 [Actinomycetota bacterium]|nr:hypothetical protein [Actinomycetota bacterium]
MPGAFGFVRLGPAFTGFDFGFAAFGFPADFGLAGFAFAFATVLAPRVRPGPAWERRLPAGVDGREEAIRHPFASRSTSPAVV